MVVPVHCDAWILIADHYHARILGCHASASGNCRLTQYGSIESPIPDVEFGRTAPLSYLTQHSYDERYRRLEEEYRRFARQLARWINRCIEQFDIDPLTAFAPERSHEEILSHIRVELRDRIVLRGENLLQLSTHALSKHPQVASLLHSHEQKQTA